MKANNALLTYLVIVVDRMHKSVNLHLNMSNYTLSKLDYQSFK